MMQRGKARWWWLASLSVAVFSVAQLSPTATAETGIVGNVLYDVSAALSPSKLPRKGAAPIAVSLGWKIGTTDGSVPPSLKQLKIEINRHGVLDPTGLPVCPYKKIQPATTSRALRNCRTAIVGKGRFSAVVGLSGQETYETGGTMIVFNSRRGGKPVLYGQIYSAYPFANSFVIVFRVSRKRSGTFGTSLTATLPARLRAWGNLTEIKMRLARKFSYDGKRRSFLSAACPTPDGVGIASFPLARTSFSFSESKPISTTISRSCRVGR